MAKKLGKHAAVARYNFLSRELQRAADRSREQPFRTALMLCATELRALHSAAHPTCRDQGPNTCPTWEAIHAAESLQRPQ